MNLDEANALPLEQFVAHFGGVFEHSAWVAAGAWQRRPFDSVENLFREMQDAVGKAGPEARLALIRAHPELAGREAGEGTLTAGSTSEQGRLGFTALGRDELERIARLNRSYRDKFRFPCIVALRLHRNRATVLKEMERRLSNDPETEISEALEQIGHIARGRLEKLVREG